MIVDAVDVDTPTKSVTLDWIAIVINLAVNMMATLLIIYQAWYNSISINSSQVTYSKLRIYHKSIRSISRSNKSQVEAILLLLIESGAVLAAVQVGKFLPCSQRNNTVTVSKGLKYCHCCTGCG